jgi:hypothetical protein
MGQSNHPIEQEELMAYLDGELSPDRAAAAVAHLERCSECQRLTTILRDVSQNLVAWEVGSSSPRILPAITVALEERERELAGSTPASGQTRRGVFRMRRFAPWALSLAAVCLVALLGFRLMVSERSPQSVFHSIAGSAGKEPQNGRVENPAMLNPQTEIFREGIARQLSDARRALDRPEHEVVDDRLHENLGEVVAGDSVVPPRKGPMIVRAAGVTLTTKDFDKARTGLDEILKRHRGYVGELNVNTPAGVGRTLTATLRVPADQLDATLAELRKLGRVEAESQSGQEVTAQYVDLEARLSNARNTERRLTELLRQQSGKLSDVLAVETELSRVRGEIESMESQRKNLANQVDFATLSATVNEDYKAQLQVMPPSTSTQFRNAAVDGYKSMVDGIVGVAVFLFSYGPSLLFWALLLFFPVRSLWRKLRRVIAK